MGVVLFLLMEITPLAILFTTVFNRFEGSSAHRHGAARIHQHGTLIHSPVCGRLVSVDRSDDWISHLDGYLTKELCISSGGETSSLFTAEDAETADK